MGAFTAGVIIPREGDPTVEHSVAIAMEPYRYNYETSEGQWKWYRIDQVPSREGEAVTPGLFAFIDRAGIWHSQLHPHEIAKDGEEGFYLDETEWSEEILAYRPSSGEEMVIVWCKD